MSYNIVVLSNFDILMYRIELPQQFSTTMLKYTEINYTSDALKKSNHNYYGIPFIHIDDIVSVIRVDK